MDAEIIAPIVLEFVRGYPKGQDLLDIRKFLEHLGSPGFQETRELLAELVQKGWLKTSERRVEGSRLATFYQLTSAGQKHLADTAAQTGLSIGRESHVGRNGHSHKKS